MPYADPEQQRRANREWVARRRAAWFAGRSCVRCGTDVDLELDHIDPALKVSARIWSWTEARREVELAKCQPLCRPCHRAKSNDELRKTHCRQGHSLADADRDRHGNVKECRTCRNLRMKKRFIQE